MSKAVAVAVLADHGVRCREAGEWLEVFSEWTCEGEEGGEWVPCPRNADRLYAWLGY